VADDSESFEQFRTSFSYGSRSDLNFKFLKALTDDEAAEVLRVILDQLGDAYDTGDISELIETAIEAQIAGYAPREDAEPPRYEYEDGPFAPLSVPLADARIGLVTTTGHFVEGDDPAPLGFQGMSQQDAEDNISQLLREAPVLSAIPSDTARDKLKVRHGGFDTTSAVIDPNVCFPIDTLASLADDGVIAATSSTFYSFPGATSQGRLKKVMDEWVATVLSEPVDAVLLVPV
jgi:hypothetical protein